jgi:hypothetical protein
MSKGSNPRPYSVSQQEFANSFDKIFRKPDPRVIEDAQIEQEAFDNIEKTVYNKTLQQETNDCK